ncbi:MAG TPA: adenylate/guanylate cyclase domain-containing protein [Acidimicrobiales bacterium]|nr:adenylate/guanylate cyclase domain-containing protein [Acidimicrobiales bacterium]
MQIPETHYARRRGLHIGYQVWGDGPVDILDFGSGTFISIDETGDQPRWLRYTERLAACGRLIRFDPSGIGLSDTPADLGELSFDAWVDDAITVMDEVGSTRAVVLAVSGSLALMFATRYPERTESLVLVNASVRFTEADDYPIGVPYELMEEFRAGLDPDHPGEGSDDLRDLRLFAPSAADDPDFQRWWERASRRGAAPATSAFLGALVSQVDSRHLLPRVTAPTLVLHRQDALAPSVEHGQYIADRIPGARFVALPGDDVVPYTGDLDALVDEIQEFVTGERYQPGPDRVLATILFTDIVDSTANAARMGDRRWTQVLLDHDGLVRHQLDRFGGRFVKDTGDGLLATFDSPARAIRCALALRDGAGHLGIQMRAGLHAGEIEWRGEDVGGIAVHVAARVVATAVAGEVLASNTVVDLVEGAGITFTDRGEHTLKGVPGLRRLWTVTGA